MLRSICKTKRAKINSQYTKLLILIKIIYIVEEEIIKYLNRRLSYVRRLVIERVKYSKKKSEQNIKHIKLVVVYYHKKKNNKKK